MSAVEVTSINSHGGVVITRHQTAYGVRAERLHRQAQGHRDIDAQLVQIETAAHACEKQARPGQRREGGKR